MIRSISRRVRLAKITVACAGLFVLACTAAVDSPAAEPDRPHWLWSTAYAIPNETTSEESGYFSIIEGKNGRLYVGTAKYGHNAYLVEFDPKTAGKPGSRSPFQVVVDAQQEIGTDATGFAAQAKFHTRNNVGRSGKIYAGTKQGYPKKGEQRSDYPGGYPMVYDPETGKTRVYDIPVPHQGIISITPDESRGVAYISTCSDERPVDGTHFLILNLETGAYRDLMDCRHMYAFIVVDYLGRAYHPVLGGDVVRFDPQTDKLQRLKQTIDGKPPTKESLLATENGHPINWDISPDRKTLYAVAMSGNQLFSYDLTAEGDVLPGKSLGPLIADAVKTDCRAMCVGPDGVVWAGVAATFEGRGQFLHLVSFRPGAKQTGPTDHGPIAISNPDYTEFTDGEGKPLPHHHGVHRPDKDGPLLPRYVIMGICAARDGTVYLTTLYPFTLHALKVPKVAGVTTSYHHNSHAELIIGRLLESDTLDGTGATPQLELASLYTDQVPARDTSRALAKKHGFRIYDDVARALTLGTGELAVDGVLLVAEHGDYPESDTGQFVFPKRRLFGEVVDVFRQSGRVVPVFLDKHLADNWKDAKWIYDTAREMNVPLMAGSSLPVLWRYPPADVEPGAELQEIVAVSYHRLDSYGFHALEMVQALAERRQGGETGIRSVQCLTGQAVWQAEREGRYDRELLDAALSRLKERPLPEGKRIEELVKEPVLFAIDYRDGLRANVFTLNYAVAEWAAAWRYAAKGVERSAPAGTARRVVASLRGTPERDGSEGKRSAQAGRVESTLFWTQEARPFGHFTYLVMGIEQMMHTGRPAWPAERTLLTSGALDALLISKKEGGRRIKTPYLDVRYSTTWNWQQPPPPPPGRPINGP